MRRLAVVLCGCLAAGLPLAELAAAGRAVAFRASDGRMVQGLIMEAPARPSPAVVLVPMFGRSKDDWQSAAQRLADANITALAIDLPQGALPGDAPGAAAWAGDVRAALDYLVTRPDVLADSLGVAGASLGATLGTMAAAVDPRVRSLALISPALDYRGLRLEPSLRTFGARPALLVASLHDPYAARSVRELVKDPAGPREIRWAEAEAHGTLLLARESELVNALAEWFQRTLAAR